MLYHSPQDKMFFHQAAVVQISFYPYNTNLTTSASLQVLRQVWLLRIPTTLYQSLVAVSCTYRSTNPIVSVLLCSSKFVSSPCAHNALEYQGFFWTKYLSRIQSILKARLPRRLVD